VKEKVMNKLDETIGDLVKYFDNYEEIDIENMSAMTKSSLY
jgi:Asp-tRNA(Asn)/Glu-tRNA(Gln) amidotransferase C subunit